MENRWRTTNFSAQMPVDGNSEIWGSCLIESDFWNKQIMKLDHVLVK